MKTPVEAAAMAFRSVQRFDETLKKKRKKEIEKWSRGGGESKSYGMAVTTRIVFTVQQVPLTVTSGALPDPAGLATWWVVHAYAAPCVQGVVELCSRQAEA